MAGHIHRVRPTYRLAAGALLPRLLAAEIFPNVTDQKTFFLKENDLEKGWYVIFVQKSLASKKSDEKVKKANEFCDANHILKNQICGIWPQKIQSGNPGHKGHSLTRKVTLGHVPHHFLSQQRSDHHMPYLSSSQ